MTNPGSLMNWNLLRDRQGRPGGGRGHSLSVIGEIGVAFVIPADPSEPPTLAELRSWVAADLADYMTPDRLVVVDDLPLTAMMKIDKTATLVHRAAETTDDRMLTDPAVAPPTP